MVEEFICYSPLLFNIYVFSSAKIIYDQKERDYKLETTPLKVRPVIGVRNDDGLLPDMIQAPDSNIKDTDFFL